MAAILSDFSEYTAALGLKITAWAAEGTDLPKYPPTSNWRLARLDHCLILAYGYLVFVFIGSFVMSRKGMEPIKFPNLQKAYNVVQVGLCGYMFIEAGRIAYVQGYTLWPCVPFNALNPPIGSVLWLFYCSKVLDFMDTFFMILGKKWAQVSFLHVYHHWSIFQIYWLNLWVGYDGDIYLTIVLNGFIHTIMYSYYLCSTQKGILGSFAKAVKPFITSMQLAQFFTMIAQASVLLSSGCTTYPRNTTKLYFGYIWTMVALFGHFFVTSYLTKPKSKNGSSKNGSKNGKKEH
jgi:elongation of very long chain fatty acids protein 4